MVIDGVIDVTPGHLLETDPAAIVGLLDRLTGHLNSATLWLNAGRSRLAVRLQGVEVERERLLLLLPPEMASSLDEGALADGAVCVLNLPDSSIRFACGRPEKLGESYTISVAIPDSVYKLARRSGFRVPAPSSTRLRVGTVDGEHDGQSLEVLDLSLGGVGVLANADYAAAREFGDCVLELPDGPRLEADMRVCNRAPFMRLNGEQGVRLGLAFLGVRPVIQMRLRRYVAALENTRGKVALSQDRDNINN